MCLIFRCKQSDLGLSNSTDKGSRILQNFGLYLLGYKAQNSRRFECLKAQSTQPKMSHGNVCLSVCFFVPLLEIFSVVCRTFVSIRERIK